MVSSSSSTGMLQINLATHSHPLPGIILDIKHTQVQRHSPTCILDMKNPEIDVILELTPLPSSYITGLCTRISNQLRACRFLLPQSSNFARSGIKQRHIFTTAESHSAGRFSILILFFRHYFVFKMYSHLPTALVLDMLLLYPIPTSLPSPRKFSILIGIDQRLRA